MTDAVTHTCFDIQHEAILGRACGLVKTDGRYDARSRRPHRPSYLLELFASIDLQRWSCETQLARPLLIFKMVTINTHESPSCILFFLLISHDVIEKKNIKKLLSR